ncbi:MAG: AAA family ATPase [Deltaproteobacteria bacterium]|nr:AAA family ATPase [Deltaproteobacteria bacterium]
MVENGKAVGTDKAPKGLVPDSAVLGKFIINNAVVVDKTSLIRQLFDSDISTYFLSRPRRFGKTLLLDTIQNIAEGNKAFFIEMEIGKDDSGYSWETYPVIRLDFAGLPHEPKDFKRKLRDRLDKIISLHDLGIRPVKNVNDIDKIIGKLSVKHPPFSKMAKNPSTIRNSPANVVLLIDEYDFPLLGNISNSDRTDKIREILHEFYSTIKHCENMLRMTFIAGILKFSKLSIFSGLNNIVDISLNPDYSAICGFTEDEIKSNFSDHMLLALPHLEKSGQFPEGSDVKFFLDQLKDWYDGYSFGKDKPNVYNPFSVTNCLSNRCSDYYWYYSGTSLAACKFRHMADIYFKILSRDLNIKETLGSVIDIKDLTIESLLFQTGYLTIDNSADKIDNSADNIGNTIINDKKSDKAPVKATVNVNVITYKLKCPNNEIFFALIQDFIRMDSPFPGLHGSINKIYSSFVNSFNSLNAYECERTFSSFLGLSAPTLNNLNETTFQNLLLCLLNILRVRLNVIIWAIVPGVRNQCKNPDLVFLCHDSLP